MEFRNAKLDAAEGEKKEIIATFIVFDEFTELFPGYYERIDKEAVKNYKDKNIKCLFNHDTGLVLGCTKRQSLRLEKDDIGLRGVVSINENDVEAVNVYERVKRGDIDACSFGFNINDIDEVMENDGTIRATIKDLDLVEVSVVTFPAYKSTNAQARAEEKVKKEQLKRRLKKI